MVSAHLPCYLSMGFLKQDFLETYLTTFFEVRNLIKYMSYEGHLFFEGVQN